MDEDMSYEDKVRSILREHAYPADIFDTDMVVPLDEAVEAIAKVLRASAWLA